MNYLVTSKPCSPMQREQTSTGILVQLLPAGTPFYRSRICDSGDLRKRMFKQPYKYVGPPPQLIVHVLVA